MKILPYSPIPGHHRAFAWTPADRTDIATTLSRWMREHTADDLVPNAHIGYQHTHYGDDYEDVERTDYLERLGAFKP